MTDDVPPVVSVVIPVWDDYVRWLGDSADSALSQDGVVPDVIVVDNGSSVELPEIPGARLLRSNRRLSTGAARNLGLQEVRGPFVVFLDADDVLLPGALRRLVDGILAHPDAVAFTMAMVDGDTGRRHRAPRRISRTLAARPRVFAAANTIWSLLPTQGATIMPTAAVRDAGGYADRSQGEDWALGAALAWRGRVRFAEDPAIVYRWRGDSPGQPGAPDTLLANARAVRERLRRDPGMPPAARRAMPAIALAQWLAVVGMRPVVRGTRRITRRVARRV